MFDKIKRLLTTQVPQPPQPPPQILVCPDCGTRNGELHELFCTKENCPFCHTQLITCDCIRSVLKLSDDELQVLDDYVDDSIPPLSTIMERWREALTAEGRIPFAAHADDPRRAAYRGDIDSLRRFLHHGFEPNSGNEVGYTALMAAARGESLEALRFLLTHGGRAAVTDHRGCTALHWAVAQSASNPERQVACVSALIEAGAPVNVLSNDKMTPLMNAAWFGCLESVQKLLTHGADPSIRDAQNRTAKDLALAKGHQQIVNLLN